MADIQQSCNANLRNAAEKMAQQHINKLGEAMVSDAVQVPVPDVDRGPADPSNILAYILKINNSHMNYQLATSMKLLKFEALDLTKERSLREFNGLHLISGGQGFLKCNCSGKCERNCKCKKNGVFCNSKCHKNKADSQCINQFQEKINHSIKLKKTKIFDFAYFTRHIHLTIFENSAKNLAGSSRLSEPQFTNHGNNTWYKYGVFFRCNSILNKYSIYQFKKKGSKFLNYKAMIFFQTFKILYLKTPITHFFKDIKILLRIFN
ncbi:KRAB-A domain-containing 2-like [Brachionus plicatilis]|uniref:KRAB-A domain-containing 2-like n=1 Tax=Brachionus plicatilis TaxID=10195 RepID=A0A3M7SYS9_BRAPC|nr:KRAB-A domain-containing 2-like [Brachionus plicatilis]